MKVGAFIAGAQKCGTTSLFAYFREHPQLAAPRMKETHFFDDEQRDWSAVDARALDELYAPLPTGAMRFDATPIYLFWPRALARIRAYHPAAKLIFLFRDPSERAYSHWTMERTRGTESLTFADAIRRGRARVHPDDRSHPSWRDMSYVERGLYGEQLARALAIFPRSQLLCLEAWRLRELHRETLGTVARFLDLAPFRDSGPKRELESAPAPEHAPMTRADRSHLHDIYRDDLQLFARLSGIDVARWPTLRPDGRS